MNKIMLVIAALALAGSASALFFYEDNTFRHDLRCCDVSNKCEVMHITNDSSVFENITLPFTCYEMGFEMEKLSLWNELINNWYLIISGLCIFILFVYILKR